MFDYTKIDNGECEFISVVAERDFLPGKRLFVEIDSVTLVLLNTGHRIYALADYCSHDHGPLGEGEIEEGEIICPRHGARFRLSDGKALRLPAVEDIPAYPVRILDGQVQVGLPTNR